MKHILVPTLMLFGLGGCAQTSAPAYELVIRGGVVVDGSGEAGYAADVGIRDGRIAEISRAEHSRMRTGVLS